MDLHQRSLHVTGLSPKVVATDLEDFCRDVCDPEHTLLVLDENGKCNGSAYLLFADEASVGRAVVELSGKRILKKPVTLRAAGPEHELVIAGLMSPSATAKVKPAVSVAASVPAAAAAPAMEASLATEIAKLVQILASRECPSSSA